MDSSARTPHAFRPATASPTKISTARRFLSWMLVFVLAFSLAPTVPFALADESGTYDDRVASLRDEALSDEEIASLLDAGSYEEGSALVVVDNTVEVGGEAVGARSADMLDAAEPLMDASAAALEQVANGVEGTEPGVSPLAANGSGESAVSIKLVRSSALSTEDLIHMLRDDPRVIAAEPNYTYELVDPAESGKIDVSPYVDDMQLVQSLPSASPNALGTATDMTAYQWGYSADANVLATAERTANLDMKVPSWQANRTDPMTENATGTVAVLDTGIDYAHPDLVSSMRTDMRSFAGYGSECGYAAASSTAGEGPMDDQGHGTHVAGIVAAKWDDSGVSGIASGARLVAIKAGDSDGRFSMDHVIEGYAYLADAVNGGLDDLVSINNSWGGPSTTYSLALAVTELGRLGAISVFASGNESTNTDNSAQTVSSLRSNPYAVVVDSATRYSERSSFSNFGIGTTDVFAPGSTILSTFPQAMSSYFPEGCDSNILFETFADADATQANVLVSADEAFGSTTGSVQGQARFDDDGGALAVTLSDLSSVGAHELNAYVAVDAGTSDPAEVQHFGWRYYTDGSPVAAAAAYVYAVDGQGAGDWVLVNSLTAGRTISDDWMVESFNIADACAAAGKTLKLDNDTFSMKVRLVSPAFAWDVSKSFYLDTVGIAPVGSEIPYVYESGTSMASPAVAGAAAVAAASENQGLAPSDKAAQRAMRLRGSVTPVASMADLCASGGAVDLSVLDTAAMVPVVLSAVASDGAECSPLIAITGDYYGSDLGAVTIGGAAAAVVSWTPARIEVECPAGIASGVLVVRVENAAGGVGQRALALELPVPPAQEGTPLYEHEYELPPLSEVPAEAMDQALIVGLGGDIYLLPRSTERLAACELWAFDSKTHAWERRADLPAEVYSPTAVAYEKTLVVSGLIGDEEGYFVSALFRLDPVSGQWTQLDIELPFNCSLANVDGTLLAVGGRDSNDEGSAYALAEVLAIDMKGKTSSVVGHLETALANPDVAVGGTTLAVGQGLSFDDEGQAFNVNGFARYTFRDGRLTGGDEHDVLPAFGPEGASSYSLAVVRDGVVSVGFSAFDSATEGFEDEDTYLSSTPPAEGAPVAETISPASAARFEGCGKRFMRGQVYNQAVCAYDGQLYAIGYLNGGSDGWVFRSTEMTTLPSAGDRTHGGGPTPNPTPTPNPLPTPLPGPDTSGLASTGDSVTAAALAWVGAALITACALAAARRKMRL